MLLLAAAFVGDVVPALLVDASLHRTGPHIHVRRNKMIIAGSQAFEIPVLAFLIIELKVNWVRRVERRQTLAVEIHTDPAVKIVWH